MGSSCAKSAMRGISTMFGSSGDWSLQRPDVIERRDKLMSIVDDLTQKECALQTRLHILKTQANTTNATARRKRDQFGGAADLSHDTAKYRTVMREYTQTEKDLEMTTKSIAQVDSILFRLNSIISQQDAVYNIAASVRGMENVGADFEKFEHDIQSAARTTDALDIITTNVGDRLATIGSIEEPTDTHYTLNVNRLPFPDIAVEMTEGEMTPLVTFTTSDLKHDRHASAIATPASRTTPATPMMTHKRGVSAMPGSNQMQLF